MKYRSIIALSLALAACQTPSIPDPRFEMPLAPESIQKPLPKLQEIKTPPKSVS